MKPAKQEESSVSSRGTVLVTDGDERSALAVVRSLGRAGYRCVVTSVSGRSLAGGSRYAWKEALVPGAGADPATFADAIAALVPAHGIDLVIPISEASLLALLPVRARIGASIPFPDSEVVRAICDKERVLAVAAGVGIRVPAQQSLQGPNDAQVRELPLPAVLKPARSVFTAADGTRAKVGVRWAHDAAELNRALKGYPAEAYPVLAQEVVRGPGIGVFVLLHEGQVLAQFAHRRVREKPPSGGVSVLRQSEPMDPRLLDRSLELLRAFDWSGVAMVEYKQDEATGEYVLMEVNGRFWGSLQLAIDAGVDFPRLLAEVSFGSSPNPVTSYRFTRSRWFWGDVDHVIACWRDRRTPWSGKLRALAGWASGFGPGTRAEVLRVEDPRPFLRETGRWLAQLVRH